MNCSIYDAFEQFSTHSGLWQAKRYVVCALQQHHKVEVARLLNTEVGASLLSTLLKVEYPSAEGECFEEVAIPLCYLLSDKDLVACNAMYIHKIYRTVLENEAFFERYVRFLNDVNDAMAENMLSSFRIMNGLDAIIPFMDLGTFILTRLGNYKKLVDVESNMWVAIGLVGSYRAEQDDQRPNMSLWLHHLALSKDRLETALNPALQGNIESCSGQSIYLTRDGLDALQGMRMKPCFPTEDEIFSSEDTTQNSDDDFSDISSSPHEDIALYAKRQFNEMRQEIIKPYRAAVRHLIHESSFSSEPRFERFRDECCEGLCDLFWDAQVLDIDTRAKRAGCFRVSIKQRYKYDGEEERMRAWGQGVGGQPLENFCVVCLMFYDADILLQDLIDTVDIRPACRLMFAQATVLTRRDLYKDYERSYLELLLESKRDINRLIDIAFGRHNHNLKAVMIQVRNPFTNVAHALCKSLQNSDWVNLPWAKQLADTRQATPLNAGLRNESMKQSFSSKSDLSFLVRNDLDPLIAEAAKKALLSVDIRDHRAVCQMLTHHSACVALDDSQIKAFSLSLREGLSLIQGNDAFGEPLVIAYVVKALLSRVDPPGLKFFCDFMRAEVTYDFEKQEDMAPGPILCVGISNSTVDVVLENLISMNLLHKNEVLRLGGQSESATLKYRNLREVLKYVPYEVPEEVNRNTRGLIRTTEFQFRRCLQRQLSDTETLKSSAKRIFVLSKDMQSMKMLNSLGAMRGVKVIGCTASGAAIQGDLIRALGPSAVIFIGSHGMHDPNILTVQTSRTENVLLSGDSLHPGPFETIRLCERGQRPVEKDDAFLFKRLVRTGAAPMETLTVQYQMHPALSKLAQLSYNLMNDSDHVRGYPDAPKGLANPVFFLDHSIAERKNETSHQRASRFISHEVEFASSLVRYLINQGYNSDQIAVLSPSHVHLIRIKERLYSFGIQSSLGDNTRYEIVTKELLHEDIDSRSKESILSHARPDGERIQSVTLATFKDFLRNVKDVVIVTMALGIESGSIGEFQSDSIVNSMITRARYGMVILGSSVVIQNGIGGKVLKDVVDYLRKESLLRTSLPLRCHGHGKITHVTMTDEIPDGCGRVCETEMLCGHPCPELCHPPTICCPYGPACSECDRDRV